MISIKEALIVEGRYDKNKLSQLFDTVIIETQGFGVFNDGEKLDYIRRIAEKRGVVIVTDSDGAGFVIRNYLKGALPKQGVYHAYIPEIAGKESRKAHAGKEGLLGVEGVDSAAIVRAVLGCGIISGGEPAKKREITKADMYALGLSGHPGSSARRRQLCDRLHLPAKISPNGLLDALNALITFEELCRCVEDIDSH